MAGKGGAASCDSLTFYVRTEYNRGFMRIGSLLFTVVCLSACRQPPPAADAKASGQISFEPNALCAALQDVGMPAGPWKRGADGFGCASPEVQVGPKDASAPAPSAVWYEVRGTEANAATSVVLGGDVRVPNSDAAVKSKLGELANHLLKKLNVAVDDELRTAIQEDKAIARRAGAYVMRYGSELAGKVRENRLTIQRAL